MLSALGPILNGVVVFVDLQVSRGWEWRRVQT